MALAVVASSRGVACWRRDGGLSLWACGWLYLGGCNAVISALFANRRGMWVLGKDSRTGRLPFWSRFV